MPNRTLTDRTIGAFLAHAVGDALGWPQEIPLGNDEDAPMQCTLPSPQFRAWTRSIPTPEGIRNEAIHAGEYSDDTQLLLAVARTRTQGEYWWKALTRNELPQWARYERGGGNATLRSARLWGEGIAPWQTTDHNNLQAYFQAGGNGVAMRILPHVVLHAYADNPHAMLSDVCEDGIATHAHPRALIGAVVCAYASWCALRTNAMHELRNIYRQAFAPQVPWAMLPEVLTHNNAWMDAAQHELPTTYAALWEETVAEMHAYGDIVKTALNAQPPPCEADVLRELGCFGPRKGAGTRTAAAAIFLFSRHLNSPTQAVLRAAFSWGADTDTLAAISGNMLGCALGKSWLPTAWNNVQDAPYLTRLASILAGDQA